MTSAALNAKVVFGDNVVVEDLKLSVLGPNHNVILDGSVGNLLTFDDYKLTLDIKAKHAKTLEKWLAANTMPLAKTIESFTYSSTFAANRKASDHKKLNDPWFPNLIAQIDVANWFTLFPLTSASLGTTLDIISKGDRIDIHNLSVKLKQDNTTLSWAGDLSNLKQNESIKGDFNADFAQDFWVWQKAPLTVQSSMTGNFELIKFPDIKIAAGKTLINGDAYLTTSNTAPKLGGQFTTPNLDTLAWTKAPKELFEADKPDKSMSFSVPEIPEWLIAFDKWSDYAFDISLKADKVASHWFNFNDFNGHFLRQKNQLTIDGGGDLTKGRMSLIYEVEKKGSQYFESLLLTGYDINQQDMPLEDPLINIKSGSIDGIVNITGRGKTSNEILASSNGRFTLSSKSVELTGDWLDDIAPDVIESVLNRINPFPKKEGEEKNTQIECGIIHFSITNGQWVAKDSIQLITPVLSLLGRGEMDFKEENLRFMFVPQTREGLGFSVMGTLTEMAAVEGPMDNPQIKIAPYEVLKKGGLNLVGMVLLGPFFAIPYNQYNKITSGPEDCFKKIKENPVPKI